MKISQTTDDKRVRKALRYSILEGIFASSMVGFGESFFSAFAVFLKANNIQLGILGSLPQTLGSLAHLFSNKLLKLFGTRKKVVALFSLLEALMYIPIILVFFLGTLKVYHLLVFTSIYWIFGMIVGPAWNSWMGDLVNEKWRGSYFGKRNKVAGFSLFISFLIGGFILEQFSYGVTIQYVGFVIIFVLAFFARLMSFIYLIRQYEPKYKQNPESHFSFRSFLRQARFRNYGLFVLYLCFMNFAVFLAGPFFAAYMLYDLKLSYMSFTIINASALIVKFIAMPIWGKASDRFGTKRVLSLAGFLMPINSFLWVFSTNIFYLIGVQVFSGFVWAGFEIASFSFIFDTTSSEKRATCIAYYNVLNGGAILLGAVIGGLVVRYNHFFWSKYILVFILSAVFRYIASFIFVPRLKEVREVEHIPYHKLLLNVITTMPTMGLIHSLITFRKKKII